jgi:hypothetical protein
MSLRDRLIKSSTIQLTSTLADSDVFTKKDMISTQVPMINVALSGDVNGGLSAGVTMIAGPSKHFKTAFALLMAKSYLDKYDDAVVLLYDSEFGSPQAYFESFDIDLNRVIHTPITDFEELRHDMSVQMENINRNDHIMILVDSIGNLPSRKEVQDAIEKDSSPADFTRAKVNKSFFRIVTPKLNLKNIPMVVINHTYKTMEMFSRDVVGGGTGSYYGADNIWILGRHQDKGADKKLAGYEFVINVEKSRFVKEKSKILINVSHTAGINKWSGLLEVAIEGGFIVKTKPGKYAVVNPTTGEIIGNEMKEANIDTNADIWKTLLADEQFTTFIRNKYQLSTSNILRDDEDEQAGE